MLSWTTLSFPKLYINITIQLQALTISVHMSIIYTLTTMQYTSMKRIRAMTLFQQNALIYKK